MNWQLVAVVDIVNIRRRRVKMAFSGGGSGGLNWLNDAEILRLKLTVQISGKLCCQSLCLSRNSKPRCLFITHSLSYPTEAHPQEAEKGFFFVHQQRSDFQDEMTKLVMAYCNFFKHIKTYFLLVLQGGSSGKMGFCLTLSD